MNVQVLDEQKGKVAREGLLGRLLWYSVPDATMLDYNRMVEIMAKVGLNRDVPTHSADHDVFRRVTTGAQRKKVPHLGHVGQFENWLVRDVASGGEDVIARRIVCEVVDPKGRRLAYAQVADVEFVRPIAESRQKYNDQITLLRAQIAALSPTQRSRRTQLEDKIRTQEVRRDRQPFSRASRLRFVWLDNCNEFTHPTAKSIMTEIGVQFSKWQGMVHDDAIRSWIRKTIMDMGATPCRSSGGIYFLEEKYADQVEALEAFCTELLPNGGECHSVEIPNTDKQVEMIRRSIEAETVGAVERKLVEIAEIRQAGSLSSDRYVGMLQEVAALKSKLSGYSDLLKRDLSAVQSRLELLEMQATGLAPLQKERGDR